MKDFCFIIGCNTQSHYSIWITHCRDISSFTINNLIEKGIHPLY
jgi:hypothetical protein